jgi:ferredoxin
MDKEAQRLAKKKTQDKLERIVSDIRSRRANTPAASLPIRAFTALIQSAQGYFLNDKTAQGYIVTNQCTHCGICATVCPAGNIAVTETVTFGSRCEVCLACAHHCPRNAIRLRNERSAARFRNAEVTLAEIQDANCRISAHINSTES